jgi:hypothetical protein
MPKLNEFQLSKKQKTEIESDILDGTVSHTEISRKLESWGFSWSEASVRRYRNSLQIDLETEDLGEKASVEVDSNGGEFNTGALTSPLDLTKDWDDVMRGFGLDPDVFEVVGDTVKMSKWQSSKRLENGSRDIIWLYSYKANFRRKNTKFDAPDLEAIHKQIASWKPSKLSTVKSKEEPCTFLINWADWQIGKSAGGGVEATVAKIEESFELCLNEIDRLKKNGRNIESVAIFNMGDPTEGCDGNYSSQLFTVELNQRDQLNLVLDLWTKGVMTLQPDVFASVLCNHGEWTRRGGNKPVTSDSDNAGGYLADTLYRVFDERDKGPEEWHIASDEMVQMVDLSGVNVAMTHGHKITSKAREAEWLRGQSIRLLKTHGIEPDLWVTAHLHHVSVDDLGPWWRFQCPSLDGGSKWYTDSSGVWSTPGTLTMLVGKHDIRGWSDLSVLGTHSGHY